MDSNISMRAPNVVGDSKGIYPRTKIRKMEESNLKKTCVNTEIYIETQRGKKHGERKSGFHYNLKKLTVVISPIACTWVSGLNELSSFSLEGVILLYR